MPFKTLASSTLAKFIMALVMPAIVLVKIGLSLGSILFKSSFISSGTGFAGSKLHNAGACSLKALGVGSIMSFRAASM